MADITITIQNALVPRIGAALLGIGYEATQAGLKRFIQDKIRSEVASFEANKDAAVAEQAARLRAEQEIIIT